jgi:hypothetical protein
MGSNYEEGGSMFLQNTGIKCEDYMVQDPRRRPFKLMTFSELPKYLFIPRLLKDSAYEQPVNMQLEKLKPIPGLVAT